MAEKDKGDEGKKWFRFSRSKSKHKKDHPPDVVETEFGPSEEHDVITKQPRSTTPASPGVSSPMDTRQLQGSDQSQRSGIYPSQATPVPDSGKGKKTDDKKEEKRKQKEQRRLEEERQKNEKVKAKQEKDRSKAQQKQGSNKGKSKGSPEKLPGDQTPEAMSPASPPSHIVAQPFPHPSDDTSGDVVGKKGGGAVREKERMPSLATSSEPSSAPDFSALTSPSQVSDMFSPSSVTSMPDEEKQSYERKIQELKEKIDGMEREAKEHKEKLQRAMSVPGQNVEKEQKEKQKLETKISELQATIAQKDGESTQREAELKVSELQATIAQEITAKAATQREAELKVSDLQATIAQKNEEVAAKEVTQSELQNAMAIMKQQSEAKDKAIASAQEELQQVKKQLKQNEEDLKFKDLDVEKLTQTREQLHKTIRDLQESRARHQEKGTLEKKQMVQEHEANLQETKQQYDRQLAEVLKQHEEEMQVRMTKELEAALVEEQRKADEQSADKGAQLHQLKRELLDERQQRAMEGERMAKEFEAKLHEMSEHHDAEVEKMIKRYEEEMEDLQQKAKEEMAQVEKVADKGQQSRPDAGTDTRVQMLQQRVQEQKQQLTKEKERMAREHQTRLAELKQQHETAMKQKEVQYQEAIERVKKDQENAMEMKMAQAERKHEVSLREKQKEFESQMKQKEAQYQEAIERQELESEAQRDIQERERQLQLKKEELRAKSAEVDSLQQKLVEKDIKISELQSGMFPSSSFEYADGSPSSHGATAAASSVPARRISVESKEEDTGHLHSNVVDLAHEISQFVDPENVLPQTNFCHHLTPVEVQQVVGAIGDPQLLQRHKPQSYLFAILPSHNTMHSVLFDYTGCFRAPPGGKRELPEGRAEEEDGEVYSSAPSSPQSQETNNLDLETPLAATPVGSDQVKHLQKVIAGFEQKLRDMAAEKERELEELRKNSEAKVEERDRKIEQLSKQAGVGAEGKFEEYFEQLTKLTEQVTLYEDTEVRHKKRIQELERVVERANEQEKHLTQAASDLSTAELKVKELKEKVRKISSEAVPCEDNEQQPMKEALVESLLDEAKDLKTELKRAATEKEELQQRIIQLEQERQRREELPQSEVEQGGRLEARYQERLQEAKKQNEEKWQKTIKDLQAKVVERDDQLRLLRATAARRESNQSTSSSVSEASISPEDAQVEVARLKKELRERERDNESLRVQLSSFERVASDGKRIQEHSKGQSRAILKLRQQVEKHKEVCEGQTERSQLSDLQAQLEKSEAEISLMQQEHRKELNALKAEKVALELKTITQNDEGVQQLHAGNSRLQEVLSDSEHKRQELAQELHQIKEKCEQMKHKCSESEQRNVQLLAINENLKAQAELVECMTMEMSRLESRVGTQNKEMADLKEQIGKKDDEIAALKAQAQTYLEDFEHERKDREEAASKMEAERAQLNYQFHEIGSDRNQEVQLYKSEAKRVQAEYDQLVEKFEAIQMELVKHKDQLEHTQAQQKEAQAQLHENHQRLEKNITETAKLHDEVLAKTQQVKQYKKQADGYKAQLEQNKAKLQQNQAELEQYKSQLATFQHHAQQREEMDVAVATMESQREATEQELQALRRERDAFRATEQELQALRGERDVLKAELHHLKKVEGDFSAAFKREYDQREQLEKKYNALMDRCDLQFRENDQLRIILSQYKIPYPPRPEATPIPPQRLPLSTATTDIPRARIQPPQDLTPRSPEELQQLRASTAYPGQQAVPLQQYHHMSPQLYQQSEQEAYQQQKLHEAIKQKEQRRQQELAMKRQQLHMQGYSDPQIRGYTPHSVQDQQQSPVGHGHKLLPNRPSADPARLPPQTRPPQPDWDHPSPSGPTSLPIRSMTQPLQKDGNPNRPFAVHLQSGWPHSGLQPRLPAAGGIPAPQPQQSQFTPQVMHQGVAPPQHPYQPQVVGGYQATTPPPQRAPERQPPPPAQLQDGAPLVAPVQASDQTIPTPIQETQSQQPPLPNQDLEASAGGDNLMKELEGDIAEAAKTVEGNTEENSLGSSDVLPIDPNLECPVCGRKFRIGEIQKFRRHVPNCTGT